ncbi:uncharacterized protein LOC143506358 [Brachyhypopomus gauderio]|uniref:uncharacterized protein LOC143506358 n=1 Tax=Brachyhypopomus gauderio TaxID=698409 RepID=UPI004041031D
MSSPGGLINVMSSKPFWTVFLGLTLILTVCGKLCEQNLNKTITRNLLRDHLFEVKNFTNPHESEKKQHIFLSVINTLCSTWKNNKDILNDGCKQDIKNCPDSRDKVIWTFEHILELFMTKSSLKSIKDFCDKHNCHKFYAKHYISSSDFESKYYDICSLSPPWPECPPIKSPSISSAPPTSMLQTSPTSTDKHSSDFVSDTPKNPLFAIFAVLVIASLVITGSICLKRHLQK